jgi:hypothetical protein
MASTDLPYVAQLRPRSGSAPSTVDDGIVAQGDFANSGEIERRVVPGPTYRILPDKRMQRAAVKSSALFDLRRAWE